MNWYRITPCPKYVISEDGEQVMNITTGHILSHNTTNYAKDGLRRVTLYYNKTFRGITRAYKQVYSLKYLKENFIKEENLLRGTDHDGGVIGEKDKSGSKFIK